MAHNNTNPEQKETPLSDVGRLKGIDVTKFGKDFLERFLAQGFGSLTKREVEVLVLNLLKSQGTYTQQSNFALSKALQIPESKVSSLLYESVLLFEADHDEYFQQGLLKALQKIKPKRRSPANTNDESYFTFVLEDKFVRTATHARLKDIGHFADGSFNTEIISISESALLSLLESFIDTASASDFKKELKAKAKEAKNKEDAVEAEKYQALAKAFIDANNKISLKGLIKKVAEGAATKSGEEVVSWLTGGGFLSVLDGVRRLFENPIHSTSVDTLHV